MFWAHHLLHTGIVTEKKAYYSYHTDIVTTATKFRHFLTCILYYRWTSIPVFKIILYYISYKPVCIIIVLNLSKEILILNLGSQYNIIYWHYTTVCISDNIILRLSMYTFVICLFQISDCHNGLVQVGEYY